MAPNHPIKDKKVLNTVSAFGVNMDAELIINLNKETVLIRIIPDKVINNVGKQVSIAIKTIIVMVYVGKNYYCIKPIVNRKNKGFHQNIVDSKVDMETVEVNYNVVNVRWIVI